MARGRKPLVQAARGPFLSLCGRIARSPALFSLKRSAAQAYRDEFTAALIRQAAGAAVCLGNEPFAEFIKQCQKHAKDLPGHLRAAIAYRARKVQLQRRAHARFVSWLGLRPMAEADKVTALESLAPTIYLPSLSTPYPDLFHWVCETAEIAELWDDWVHKAKLADQRMSRRPMLIEDPRPLLSQLTKMRSYATAKWARSLLLSFGIGVQTLLWLFGSTQLLLRLSASSDIFG